jgi:hypothetical protein
VVVGDLNEHDMYAVRVLDPRLDRPPQLSAGFPSDCHSRRHQAVTFGRYVADLQPDPKRSARRLVSGGPGYFEQSLADEEDQARILSPGYSGRTGWSRRGDSNP